MSDSGFACLALLEDKTYELFELMMKKSDDSQTSLLLDVILQETRKHRELLRHLSKEFEKEVAPSETECGKQLGEFFTKSMSLIHSARDEVHGGMPVAEAARKLIAFEQGAGEEYLTQLNVNVRLLVERNPAVRKILEGIADDEKGHIEILKLIIEIASKPQSPL